MKDNTTTGPVIRGIIQHKPNAEQPAGGNVALEISYTDSASEKRDCTVPVITWTH